MYIYEKLIDIIKRNHISHYTVFYKVYPKTGWSTIFVRYIQRKRNENF